ncbi:MAG: GspE/PulE family protein [Pseudomonadota bacterium]
MLDGTSKNQKDRTIADLGLALIQQGLIDEVAYRRAMKAADEGNTQFDRALLELGLLDEESLLGFLSRWLDIPLAGSDSFRHAAIAELKGDAAFLHRMNVVPLCVDQGTLVIATTNPFDAQLAQTISFQIDMPVSMALAARETIREVLDRDYPNRASDKTRSEVEAEADDVERLKALANEGPTIRLVNEIMSAAVDAAASDIHFEAHEIEMVIRFRIDGQLAEHRRLRGSERSSIVSRLKVMSNLNISERRRPQDGRLRSAVRGRNIDFRMATLPTQFGESIVLRILDRSQLALDWSDLGFSPLDAAAIERLTGRPHGIFLVTGPTGSGKTTTLYTALSKLDIAGRKIFTVEDPIEFTLTGVNQVQVRPELDLTFGTSLRAILRQDPDVVMVGEIRDKETAENAIRAALMGRMVLSTVHTNSAIGAIDRLIDLGVPAFLLGATLNGILSQRLVRKVCSDCAVPDTEAAGLLPPGIPGREALVANAKVGKGCAACGMSGSKGRVVISELLEIREAMRPTISKPDAAETISHLARNEGMTTLLEDGLERVNSSQIALRDLLQFIDWS